MDVRKNRLSPGQNAIAANYLDARVKWQELAYMEKLMKAVDRQLREATVGKLTIIRRIPLFFRKGIIGEFLHPDRRIQA